VSFVRNRFTISPNIAQKVVVGAGIFLSSVNPRLLGDLLLPISRPKSVVALAKDV
jgi:hypothetical protein